MLRWSRNAFSSLHLPGIDHTKRRIAAIADVNHGVANGRCSWTHGSFLTAPLDLTRLKPSYLRHSVGTLVDYVDTAGVAGWHPYSACRAIVCKVVQSYDAGCAR